MNKILPLTTEYITPSRSIEILTLINQKESKLVYIYNFEGIHFRFFDSLLKLIEFFGKGIEPEISFLTEQELDNFLERFGLGDLSTELNIKLNYRYRDAHNYKEFGSVVFAKSLGMSIESATALLREKLISEEFFVPQDWGLPRLHSQPYNPEVDHEWHEFEEFELTEESATDGREIKEFLEKLVKGYETGNLTQP